MSGLSGLSGSDVLLLLVYAAVLVLPGLVVTLAAGLRGWTAVAAAPLVGYGVTAALVPFGSNGLGWGPRTLIAGSAVLAVAVGLLHLARAWWQRRHPPAPPPNGRRPTAAGAPGSDPATTLAVLAGVVGGALLGALTVLGGVGRLAAVHQDWDATFHANAVRFILDSGTADPTDLAAVNNYEDASFFYPDAYHAVGAAVGGLDHAVVPALLNAQMVLLPGTAALALAALLRAAGARTAIVALAPFLLATFTGFTADLFLRGPLLPFAAGIALVPAFLALLVRALDDRRPATVVLAAVAAVGLLGLHPSAALTAAVFALALLVDRWVRHPRWTRRELPVLLATAVLAVLAGLPFVAGALAVTASETQDWPATQSVGQAVGDLLLLNHGRDAPQFWLAGLVFLGLLGMRRLDRLWWLLAAGAVFGGLFVAASAYDQDWAETITAPWWNDAWRFVAICCLPLAVPAAQGVVTLGGWLLGLVRLIAPAPAGRAAYGAAFGVVLAIYGLLSNGWYVPADADRIATSYADGPTVSALEEDGFAELARLVAPDQRVMNDPLDGSPWMYALAGVRPVYGHVTPPARRDLLGPVQNTLYRGFRCLDYDPEVRRIVTEQDIGWAFVGRGFVRSDFRRIFGMTGLAGVASLREVYRNDDAVIYRVELAPLRDAPRRGPCAPAADPAG